MKITAVLKSMDFKQLWSLFWLSIKNLRFVIPTIRGTRKTVAICTELYGDAHHHNGPENAFRHALWNVLIVKQSLAKGRALDQSLDWAQKITDWHEDFSPNAALARAMDLHNNQIGRNIVAQFPDKSEDFLVGHLLKMIPLSRKHTSLVDISLTTKELVHIED